MTTFTIKINERTKAGKAFRAMTETFLKDAKGIEIVENKDIKEDEIYNPEFVKMEMDLGWVIVAENDPLAYFAKYPGRFPLWHLKDMDMKEKHSTEFGKGGLDIKKMLSASKKSGMKYFFVEQEEYTGNPFESLAYNYGYLKKLK